MSKKHLIKSGLVIALISLASYGPSISSNELNSSSNEVKIGNQIWATENLNVDKFRNDDIIPQAKTNGEWKNACKNKQAAWCYYENDTANGTLYGKLYNWYAVNDPRGIAPVGYHVPTDAEWTKLTTKLGGEVVAGGKMKSTGQYGFNYPILTFTNESGFSGLPGGGRNPNGKFEKSEEHGYWWTATESAKGDAWSRWLFCNKNEVYRSNGSKSEGLSVRCIKD